MSVTVAQSSPTARKPHGCNDCGGRIEPGELYVRSAVADGGEMWTWKEHADCHADAQRMIGLHWFDPGDEWPGWGSFAEMRGELHKHPPP